VTDASLAHLASRLPLLTRLGLSEAQSLSAEGLAAALPLLPCLAALDLTCCWQVADERLLQLLAAQEQGPGASTEGPGLSGRDRPGAGVRGSGRSGAKAWLTPANIQLPQGGSSPTGSPFKRRSQLMAA
jgi:hypothetical protein